MVLIQFLKGIDGKTLAVRIPQISDLAGIYDEFAPVRVK